MRVIAVRTLKPVMRLLYVGLYFGLAAAGPANAGQIDLSRIEAVPQRNAALPPALLLRGEQDEPRPLQRWLGNAPTVWIIADFTCKTLCGPVVSVVSDALRRSGLRPGPDFQLVVVGFDPKDTAADAATMKRAQVGDNDDLSRHTFFLRGGSSEIAELTKVFGFRSQYDSEHDQFAHPAAAFVVTPGGHITRALSGLALDAADLRLALVEAGQGRVGSWSDHVRLMCYGFDPASGAYTAAVGRIVASAGALTIAVLAVFIFILFRRGPAMPAE
jgi:protein SCO1